VTGVTDRAGQRALIERFVRERPGALLLDASGPSLLDVFSGKAFALDFAHLAAVEERQDTATRRSYLALLRDDGKELALSDAGVAFAPVTAGTGLLPGLPAAVCLRDLAGAEARLTHFLLDHPGEPPERVHVELFLFCLSIVAGARAVGLDVAAEERRLERVLGELEARRRG
jgi:hypothetical protein